MEGISIQLQIIAGIAVVGALVETFFPGLISEKLKDDLSVLTIAIIGILLSFLLLMLLLKVAEGKISMSGADYQNWDDSNDAAYAFAATQLNLVITGEYIPPIIDEQPA